MKYYFPVHLDGGNRGCEGIAKGTAKIIGYPPKDLIGLCTDVELDKKLEIDKYVSLQPIHKLTIWDKLRRKGFACFHRAPSDIVRYNYRYIYGDFISQIGKDDLVLSTGGDMMCYDNNQVIYTTNCLFDKGVRSILWGCSMGPENLTPEKESVLKKFSLIYARESLTYSYFKELGLKNVVCLPDPAFVLESQPVELPEIIKKGNVVELNITNYTVGGFTLETPMGKEIIRLMDYIIEKTDLFVLLIPHVFWKAQDDRILANLLYELYSKHHERIEILKAENLNYLEIRYIISKLKYFIGGRTHAVISAYSTCVPTIALGYSIKSRGIAKDLGLPEELVANCKKIAAVSGLQESFNYLISNEKIIRRHLQFVIPEYSKTSYQIHEVLYKMSNY